MPVLRSLDEINSYPFSPLEQAQKVLMIKPDYFNIEYQINPYMAGEDGTLGKVDEKRARFQWDKLKTKIEELGVKVFTMPGQEGFPDMVFAANQSLPLDSKRVLLAKMANPQRAGEVSFLKDYFLNHGMEVKELPDKVKSFEGTGDGIWHFGMDLLWVGHGFRTTLNAVDYLGDELGLAVVPLKLVDENFYHLDTCFSVLDSRTVAWVPKAFDTASQNIIDKFFPKRIEIPYEEAKNTLACNCWSLDGKNILTPEGSKTLNEKLQNHDFIVHEMDTSEFLKSGGSVFCLKLAFF